MSSRYYVRYQISDVFSQPRWRGVKIQQLMITESRINFVAVTNLLKNWLYCIVHLRHSSSSYLGVMVSWRHGTCIHYLEYLRIHSKAFNSKHTSSRCEIFPSQNRRVNSTLLIHKCSLCLRLSSPRAAGLDVGVQARSLLLAPTTETAYGPTVYCTSYHHHVS